MRASTAGCCLYCNIHVCYSEGRYRALKGCDQCRIFLLLFWAKGTALSAEREYSIPKLLSVGIPRTEHGHALCWAWAYLELSVGMPWAEREHALSWGWAYPHWHCVVLEVNTYVLEEHAASVFRVELCRCSWGQFAWKVITWWDPSEWEKT